MLVKMGRREVKGLLGTRAIKVLPAFRGLSAPRVRWGARALRGRMGHRAHKVRLAIRVFAASRVLSARTVSKEIRVLSDRTEFKAVRGMSAKMEFRAIKALKEIRDGRGLLVSRGRRESVASREFKGIKVGKGTKGTRVFGASREFRES